jgi:hypothetical protein
MWSRVGGYVRQHHLALLCLFLILGSGTAWALGNNSVKSRHIKDGAVRTKDLADDAVTSAKVADGSISVHDLQGMTGTVFDGLDVAAGTCVDQDLPALGLQADDGVLVVPRRGDGADPRWDPRLIMDGYGPKAPNESAVSGVTVRICNVSNEAVADARLAFYVIALS